MIDIKDIVSDITRNIKRLEGGTIKHIAAKVIGIKFNSWGEVESLSPALLAEVSRNPDVVAATETVKASVIAAIKAKPITKQQLRKVVMFTRDLLISDIRQSLLEELREDLEAAVLNEVREEIKKDPVLVTYLVASKFVDANKNCMKDKPDVASAT